jgi:hypothetical protein
MSVLWPWAKSDAVVDPLAVSEKHAKDLEATSIQRSRRMSEIVDMEKTYFGIMLKMWLVLGAVLIVTVAAFCNCIACCCCLRSKVAVIVNMDTAPGVPCADPKKIIKTYPEIPTKQPEVLSTIAEESEEDSDSMRDSVRSE